MIRLTTAILPIPKIRVMGLKLNNPTNNHTSAPMITSVKAIIVVIFMFYPPRTVFAVAQILFKEFYTKIFSKTNLSKEMLSIKSSAINLTELYLA